MKRILVRMSAVTAIVVPGVIAAAYAQRSFRNSAPASGEVAESAADSSDAESTAVPPATAKAAPPSADPFSGSRLTSQSRAPANRGYDRRAHQDDPATASAHADLTDEIPAADDSFHADTEVVQADYEDAAGRYGEVAAAAETTAGRYARRSKASAKSAAEKAPQSLPVDPAAREAIDEVADAADAAIDDAADALDEAAEAVADAAGGSRYQRAGREPAPVNPLDEPEDAPLDEGMDEEPAAPATVYADEAEAEPIEDIATATTRTPPAAPTGLEGAGRPGTDEQEGAQAPTITIEKFAPDEIQIGKQATFEISVRNTGQTVAHDVEVIDAVPQGTQLVATDPPAQAGDAGDLIWSLGTLKPGDERIMKIDLLPTAEGEVGSVAHVRFSGHATARTLATRPKLEIELQSPREVLIGELVNWSIRVSNPGTGIATGVVLEAALPAGLEHEAGTELEYEVGDLRPNESRTLDLQLKATGAGVMSGEIAARGDGDLRAEKQAELEVLAPGLVLGLKGSKKRYLEREATYTISVSNPGTAAANDIELAAVMPEGLQFVKADNYGEYDAQTRTVHWSLEELPPGETGEVTMTAMPTAAGEQALVVEGSAAGGLSQKQEHAIQVDGVSAIMFTVVDVSDPIEVDGEATYEVRVVNQGSKAAAGVRLAVTLPKGMKPLDAEGPSRHVVEGSQVVFDSLEQLGPKADATYLVRAQAITAGDQRIAVQLVTDELSAPVTKEESTRVLDNQ